MSPVVRCVEKINAKFEALATAGTIDDNTLLVNSDNPIDGMASPTYGQVKVMVALCAQYKGVALDDAANEEALIAIHNQIDLPQ